MAGKEVTISQLVLEIDLLRAQVFSLEQTNHQLQHERQQLREENQRLQDQIARLKRDSSNSSKPPSSDIVKPQKKGTPGRKGKRKIGGQKGHPRQERIPFAPEDIDATRFYVLPAEQVQDLIPLDDWFILQQVDLVQKLYRVTEHRARKYLDPRTGRIVVAPLPAAVKAAGLVTLSPSTVMPPPMIYALAFSLDSAIFLSTTSLSSRCFMIVASCPARQ